MRKESNRIDSAEKYCVFSGSRDPEDELSTLYKELSQLIVANAIFPSKPIRKSIVIHSNVNSLRLWYEKGRNIIINKQQRQYSTVP